MEDDLIFFYPEKENKVNRNKIDQLADDLNLIDIEEEYLSSNDIIKPFKSLSHQPKKDKSKFQNK